MTNRVVFCPTCEREVVLKRKDFKHMYHEILCFMVVLTLGLGFFILLILKYRKKPNTCPSCEAEFDLKNLPENPIYTSRNQTNVIDIKK